MSSLGNGGHVGLGDSQGELLAYKLRSANPGALDSVLAAIKGFVSYVLHLGTQESYLSWKPH